MSLSEPLSPILYFQLRCSNISIDTRDLAAVELTSQFNFNSQIQSTISSETQEHTGQQGYSASKPIFTG